MKIYPMITSPVFKQYIWGGDNLLKYNKNIPDNNAAESWEIACHKNGCSSIKNGEYAGKTLPEVIEILKGDLLGNNISENEKFPLLLKVLDANNSLSVQVHPEDDYAFTHENGEKGKTEMWYILDAKPNSTLVYGFKPGVTKKDYEESINNGTLEEILNYVPVKKGDTLFIPAGTVHAIGSGLIIAEMQQNSDTTYRVYDYNRVGADGKKRELHVEKALDVSIIDSPCGKEITKGLSFEINGNKITYLLNCDFFAFEKIEISKIFKDTTNNEKMHILFAAEGNGEIVYNEGTVKFNAGDSIVIPAKLENYEIKGKSTILKFYVPDSKADMLNKLKGLGFKENDFSKISG